ncbi:MAG: PD-(D/E)XK nuclease family protein [Armatimonadota bacterium]
MVASYDADRNTDLPEIVDPIDLPERPFTARNLADYQQCPQKFLLSWFVPREETRRFLGGPASLHQALREALVDCHRLGGPRETTPERIEAVFDDAWDGSACADSLEEERLHAQGLKMLREFHAGRVGGSAEIVEVDLRMEAGLGDHRFVSVADVVLREADGGVNAVRWLSTRKPPSVNDIYDSTGWGIFFACVQEHFPDEDVSVTMYSLRRCSGHRVRFSDDELAGLVRRATRLADRIRVATEFPCVTGMHCRWCRARSRCPALE